MNFFVEGLQGSGKSTLVNKLSELHPGCTAVREGDYSPVELAWCAYMDEKDYLLILEKYSDMREKIEEKTFSEGDKKIVCYTKIQTQNHEFYKDLEQYEIYNGRTSFDEFKRVILSRYKAWKTDNSIFECSLFQNITEDMILFRNASDDEIIELYKLIRDAIEGKDYHIFYLKADDIKGNFDVIRKERSDDKGNELWFPLMLGFFNGCPYAKSKNLSGEEDLIRHFVHRQDLELRICKEIFDGKFTVISSKNYSEEELKL